MSTSVSTSLPQDLKRSRVIQLAQSLTRAQFESLSKADRATIAKAIADEEKAKAKESWAKVYDLSDPIASFLTFCQAFIRIVTKDIEVVPLIWNASQWAFMRARTGWDVWLKGRQLGATTLELARDLWFAVVHPHSSVLVVVQVDKENKHVQLALKKLKQMLELFGATVEAHWSGPTVSFGNGSTVTVVDCGGSVATANKQGRGGTYHRVHVTESAFFPYGEEVINAILKAVPAKENGGEYTEESTANGSQGVFFNHVEKSPANGLTVHFAGWYFAEEYRTGIDESPATPRTEQESEVIAGALSQGWTLSKSQLAWWRTQYELEGWDKTRQEFPHSPESAFLKAGSGYFDPTALERMKDGLCNPLQLSELMAKTARDGTKARPFKERLCQLFSSVNRGRGLVLCDEKVGGLWVWEPPTASLTEPVSYLISVDTASGASEDWLVAMVFNRNTLSHCATLRLKVQTPTFSTFLKELGYSYGAAMIVVERNNHGHAVLGNLLELGYPHIWRPNPEKVQLSDLGFTTGPGNRQLFIDQLVDAVQKGQFRTKDKVFHAEASTFIRWPDGKVKAAAGKHDDEIMCAAIGWRVMVGPTPKRGTVEPMKAPGQAFP